LPESGAVPYCSTRAFDHRKISREFTGSLNIARKFVTLIVVLRAGTHRTLVNAGAGC
jgi:hypothetical protein